VPQRAKDEIGIAVARAQSGAHYVDAQSNLGLSSESAEITAEITYVSQITAWLAVRPDIQYVVNPNTNPTIHNAWVFQFVFEVTL
jgi:porin